MKLVATWVRGWAICRQTPPPEVIPGGFLVRVGRPGHVVRYVLPRYDAEVVRTVTDGVVTPGTWLKVCADPGDVGPRLPPGWRVRPREYLMHRTIETRRAGAPEAYRLELEQHGEVIDAIVRAADGDVAARGRCGRTGDGVVIDQVETAPAHRRRGLGRLVMTALESHAAAQGAHTAVLVATEDGRALYRTLGWELVSPVTAAVFTPG